MSLQQNNTEEMQPEIFGFYMPKSLVGRSIFFLFSMPLIKIAFAFVWVFFYKILANILAGNFSIVKFDSIAQSEKFFKEYFVLYLPNQIFGFINLFGLRTYFRGERAACLRGLQVSKEQDIFRKRIF